MPQLQQDIGEAVMGRYKKVITYSDGAARGNPGPAGAGGEIRNSSGDTLAEISEYLGETTNNVAEYKALILTLERALQYAPSEIDIHADSELLVKQLNGEYKVKNEGLKPLFERVKQLLSGVKKATVKHVYRSVNARADELANEAIDRFKKGEVAGKKADDPSTQEGFEQGTLF